MSATRGMTRGDERVPAAPSEPRAGGSPIRFLHTVLREAGPAGTTARDPSLGCTGDEVLLLFLSHGPRAP